MKKLEIVMSQAVEEDFFNLCKRRAVLKAYTKYDNVCGEGVQVPKLGSPIWPQLNTSVMVVCADKEASVIKQIISELRTTYPDDGIFCAVSDAELV